MKSADFILLEVVFGSINSVYKIFEPSMLVSDWADDIFDCFAESALTTEILLIP